MTNSGNGFAGQVIITEVMFQCAEGQRTGRGERSRRRRLARAWPRPHRGAGHGQSAAGVEIQRIQSPRVSSSRSARDPARLRRPTGDVQIVTVGGTALDDVLVTELHRDTGATFGVSSLTPEAMVRHRVLIVEDEQDIADLIKHAIERAAIPMPKSSAPATPRFASSASSRPI